jgi:glucose-6-phosphate 1-dehydrogenase
MTPPDHVIVIFGADGDLARRMLLPAWFHLHEEGWLPNDFRIIGNSRSDMTDDEFRDFARASVGEFCRGGVNETSWEEFASRLSFVPHEFGPGSTSPVAHAVQNAGNEMHGTVHSLFYLAVPPAAFSPITRGLGEAGLAAGAKVVYEKPFGTDREGFRKLNKEVHEVLSEDQIYRIDHFLGKEAVQNLLALRFANGMFEPIWNRDHIDHVQIDVPETIGIGTRGDFYERTGCLRDMIVTHLFQVLSIVAMGPPKSMRPDDLIDEKVRVLEAMQPLRPEDVVRGQYEGYRQEEGVAEDSQTETFVACRVFLDTERWAGVPFYLRTGKRMASDRWAVSLGFKMPPPALFDEVGDAVFARNYLTFEIDPQEHIKATFLAKVPGPAIELGRAFMEFRSEGAFHSELIDAYERLIHDALMGDRTLFTRGDGIEATWEAVSGILASPPEVRPYPQGSWGPPEAEELIAPDRWYFPEG